MGRPLTAPTVTPAPPTLPQPGPGGLQIASVEASPVGRGASTGFSIDLPISPGRGYAPQLALNSGNGNGVFGWGWDMAIPSIRRRFDHGMPAYQRSDEFLGPDGEVLVATGSRNGFNFNAPPGFTAAGYMPRKESAFSRITFLQSDSSMYYDFWVAEKADGEILVFGMSDLARIVSAQNDKAVAAWLLHESVSPDGQHIYYTYNRSSPGDYNYRAYRYPKAIYYGNVTAKQSPFLYDGDPEDPDEGPQQEKWLFTLLFDYSKPTNPWEAPASYATITAASYVWRADCHTSYGYGFPLPCDYLCRQVLMYHSLDGNKQLSGSGTPTLISRLWLDYEETPAASRLMGTQRMAYDTAGAWNFLPIVDIEWSADFSAPKDASCWALLNQAMILPNSGVTPEHDPILYSESDLYSEGAAGLLHRIGNCWYYRRGVRDQRTGAAPRAITFGPRKLLDRVPLISGGADSLLMDINGDGCLESVKTGAGGLRGYHTMQADRTWSAFIPVQTLPTEIAAPYAVFGNMHGSGLPDLFVLSPTSVRYYINQSDDTQVSFSAPRDVVQNQGIVLPIPGRNPREWVNFADVLGSGQPHLVRLRHDSLTYWPWLGDGRFGTPVTLSTSLPFDLNTFDPARVSFLSLFGPQAPDLVYADVDDIKIFPNQCGNGYDVANVVKIPYPKGFHRGSLADIRFSDMAGTGGTSIVLVQPYGNVTTPYGYTGFGATRYWRVDLNTTVPYQLTALDNNCGARTEISWRSSVQDWVDEKVETSDGALTNRPSARMAVDQIAQVDCVANLQRISSFKYRDGIWDGREREPRGYRYLESSSAAFSYSNAPGFVPTARSDIAPVTIRQWLHAGRATDTQRATFYGKPYSDSLGSFCGTPDEDATAYQYMGTRLTSPSGAVTNAAPWFDAVYAGADPNTLWWLHRSLAGSPLRTETYDARAVPLSVVHHRWQVRVVKNTSPYPCALPTQLETITYDYEGYAADPLITQRVEMDADQYGFTTWKLDIAYPRQLKSTAVNPYVDAALAPAYRIPFPVAGNGGGAVEGLSWQSTFDSQQTILRITESRFQSRNMSGTDYRLGILQADRQNVLTYDDNPAVHPGGAGLHVESFTDMSDAANPLAPGQTRHLLAQSSYEYVSYASGPLVLLLATRKALMTTADYNIVIANGMSDDDLAAAGYEGGPMPLTVPGGATEDDIYIGRFAFNTYNSQSKFWTLASQQASTLASPNPNPGAFPGAIIYPVTTFTWDANCVITTSATDPYGSVISAAAIDYRFLVPTTILDPNMNKQQVQLDALGRVIATSFSGTQLKEDGNGVAVEQVGFDDLETYPYDGNFDGGGLQNQATRIDYRGNNMMCILLSEWNADGSTPFTDKLVEAHYAFLTGPTGGPRAHGFLRSRGRTWLAANPIPSNTAEKYFIQSLQETQPLMQPLIYAVQAADAFSTTEAPLSTSQQQLLLTTTYVDGLNRTLSNFLRVPQNAQAWLVADDGTMAAPPGPMPADSCTYAARDYTLFAPDGAVLTRWPAFFIKCDNNSNRNMFSSRARASTFPKYGQHEDALPPDQYRYDALGREIQVITGRISNRTGQPYERRTYYAPWFTLAQDENDIDDERPAASEAAAEGFIARMARLSRRNRASKRRRSPGRR